MRPRLAPLLATWLTCAHVPVFSGDFVNLGFDEGFTSTAVINAGLDKATRLVPGWDVSSPWLVGYNLPRSYANFCSILDKPRFGLPPFPVVGRFSMGIFCSNGASPGESPAPFVLQQSGDVPPDAEVMRFLYVGVDVRVFMNDEQLSVFLDSNRPSNDPLVPTYPYLAADVRPFAGHTVDLRFEFRLAPSGATEMQVIDNISFGVIPEPSAVSLFGLGGLGLWWILKHRTTIPYRCHELEGR